MKKEEEINVDDLKRWKKLTPFTSSSGDELEILSDEEIDILEKKKKINPFKERKLKKDHWNNTNKEKTVITCRDGKELKIYYPTDQTTGEKLMNFWFTKNYNPTITISGAIEIERNIKEHFFPNKYIPLSEEGTILRNSVKDKYFVDIIKALIERESTTTKELAKIINIKEQDARKHLNNLEQIKLLRTYRYNKGEKMYRFALSKEKVLDIKMLLDL